MNEFTFFDFFAGVMYLVGDFMILISLLYAAIIFVVRAILNRPLNRVSEQAAMAMFGVLFSTFGLIAKVMVERGGTAVMPIGFMLGFNNTVATLFILAAVVLLIGTFVIPRAHA